MSLRIIGAAIVFFILGCGAHQPPATAIGQPVRLTSNAATVANCSFVANVAAYSGWGGSLAQGLGESEATNSMLAKAAGLGADTVLLSTSNVGTSGATMRGEAYLCGK